MLSRTFWRGRAVIVTGGSGGIGREICLAAAGAGARVGAIARRPGPLDDVVAVVRAAGGVAEAETCDVVDAEALASAVAALERRLGPCDVAIACAGIHRESWPLDAAAAREVFDVNVAGAVGLVAAALPGMLARGHGHLCGVASIAALLGLPGNAAYCASKAALVTFLEGLRIDCGPAGVKVTTACPGYVDTPMVTDAERARGGLLSAATAAALVLRAVERGRAEAWFPRRQALAARLARLLPPTLRDRLLRGLPAMPEAPRG